MPDGDVQPTTNPSTEAEFFVGPVYYRLIFGGTLDPAFAAEIGTAFLNGQANPSLRLPRPWALVVASVACEDLPTKRVASVALPRTSDLGI